MIQSLCVEASGVALHKFMAQVDVVAENIHTGNLLIKMWNQIYKEFSFSDDEGCWVSITEFKQYPSNEKNWKKVLN